MKKTNFTKRRACLFHSVGVGFCGIVNNGCYVGDGRCLMKKRKYKKLNLPQVSGYLLLYSLHSVSETVKVCWHNGSRSSFVQIGTTSSRMFKCFNCSPSTLPLVSSRLQSSKMSKTRKSTLFIGVHRTSTHRSAITCHLLDSRSSFVISVSPE